MLILTTLGPGPGELAALRGRELAQVGVGERPLEAPHVGLRPRARGVRERRDAGLALDEREGALATGDGTDEVAAARRIRRCSVRVGALDPPGRALALGAARARPRAGRQVVEVRRSLGGRRAGAADRRRAVHLVTALAVIATVVKRSNAGRIRIGIERRRGVGGSTSPPPPGPDVAPPVELEPELTPDVAPPVELELHPSTSRLQARWSWAGLDMRAAARHRARLAPHWTRPGFEAGSFAWTATSKACTGRTHVVSTAERARRQRVPSPRRQACGLGPMPPVDLPSGRGAPGYRGLDVTKPPDRRADLERCEGVRTDEAPCGSPSIASVSHRLDGARRASGTRDARSAFSSAPAPLGKAGARAGSRRPSCGGSRCACNAQLELNGFPAAGAAGGRCLPRPRSPMGGLLRIRA